MCCGETRAWGRLNGNISGRIKIHQSGYKNGKPFRPREGAESTESIFEVVALIEVTEPPDQARS
jgi:hypothetical protein